MTGSRSRRYSCWLLGLQVALAAVLACLIPAGLAAATPQHGAFAAGISDATTYLDPTGDAVDGELDISVVAFDLDRSSGRITVSFTVTGFDAASWDGRPRNVQVYVASRGAQLALMVEGGPQDLHASIGHPTTTSWALEDLPLSMSFSRNGDVLTWGFSRSELDITDGVSFLLYAQIPDTRTNTWRITDRAPQTGWWSYAVEEATNVTAVFLPPLTFPTKPVAGKRFTFAMRVKRSDNGAALTSGTMTCDPSVGGVVLKHDESFTDGLARLSFIVPKTAKGKLLKIRVKISTGGASATKVVSYKVT